MLNKKIKYIDSKQAIYDYIDFLALYNKIDRLDSIIESNYANFK